MEKRFPDFAALLAAINSGEINPAEISVWLDNDCISFIGPAHANDPEAAHVDLLGSDESPEEMMRGLLRLKTSSPPPPQQRQRPHKGAMR